ncbi:O-methyltransferase MdmC-like isoform X1 [Littorina saxatilis]
MTDTENIMSSPAQPRRRYDPAIEEFQKVLGRAIAANVDPEVIEGLKRALSYVDMREDYTLECTSQESDTCRRIRETTMSHPWTELKEQGKALRDYNPRMLSGPLAGQFLKSLVSGQRARRVLDVGMYTGYSALSMAEALPAGGEVITLDMDPFLQQHNQPFFDSSPHGAKISIRIGRALDTMRELVKEGQKFDIIFLDAEKSEYIDYLKLAFDEGLLSENGTIVVDNAYRHGSNYLPSDSPPDASRLFGRHVTNDARLHKVLVPLRDGILLIRRLNEVERDAGQ